MSVKVNEIAKQFKLEQVNLEVKTEDKYVINHEVGRPSMVMLGNFKYYHHSRIQIIGYGESESFLNQDVNKQKEIIEFIINEETPMMILSNDATISDEFIKIATKREVPIYQTSESTINLFARLTTFIQRYVAPETSVHGVLVDIFGIGVLLKGESGIGKSEIALDLISKGHRLVSDDRVILKEYVTGQLTGFAPEIIKNRMEIRGIGIVDISKLYGIQSIMREKELDLIIELSHLNTGDEYERFGSDTKDTEIINSRISTLKLPLSAGRSAASIVEAAVINFIQKRNGIDSSKEFENDLNNLIKEKKHV